MIGSNRTLTSTVGIKYLVAGSGVLLVTFVFFHMLGSLQIHIGPDALNYCAALLKSSPGLLWGARGGLLLAFVFHFWGIAPDRSATGRLVRMPTTSAPHLEAREDAA